MRTPNTADTAEVLALIDPDHWSVEFRDGEPVLGISVQGAADYVSAIADELVPVPAVLEILADLLPAEPFRSVVRELELRGEVIADA